MGQGSNPEPVQPLYVLSGINVIAFAFEISVLASRMVVSVLIRWARQFGVGARASVLLKSLDLSLSCCFSLKSAFRALKSFM